MPSSNKPLHDVQFSCAIYQPLLAHHWRVHQCLLMSRFIAPSIPWGVSALVVRCGSSFLRTVTFLIIHRFLPLKFPLLYICFSKSTAYNTFQFKKNVWIWWKILDTIISWQDVGPCCEQTHAAFEVGLSLDHGQGVYSGWSDVVVSSQLRLCHMCIIDVMACCNVNVNLAEDRCSHLLAIWHSIANWLSVCANCNNPAFMDDIWLIMEHQPIEVQQFWELCQYFITLMSITLMKLQS